MLKPNAESSDMVLGSWFMAEPNAFDGKDAEFAGQTASGSNKAGNFQPVLGARRRQGDLPAAGPGRRIQEPYYAIPKKTGKSTVVEPYSYDVAGKSVLMTSVVYPVFSHGQFIGAAGLDMALDSISKTLGALKPLGGGRVMMLSPTGKWVAHPDKAKRMQPYADAGADQVPSVLAGGAAVEVKGVVADGVPMARIIRPCRFRL
jgi:methyl-accepting chemotaxis protein